MNGNEGEMMKIKVLGIPETARDCLFSRNMLCEDDVFRLCCCFDSKICDDTSKCIFIDDVSCNEKDRIATTLADISFELSRQTEILDTISRVIH